MKWSMNRLMQPLVSGVPASLALPTELEDRLLRGYSQEGDCVLWRPSNDFDVTSALTMFKDATAVECAVNHFHFSDDSPQHLATTAIGFCQRAESAWMQSPLVGDLRFIVSIRDVVCTIRFHVLRPGIQWLEDDLDEYQDEAILVWETRSKATE